MAEKINRRARRVSNDEMKIAQELHYPDIVIDLLGKEPDQNKRQHILADARAGLYDGPQLSAKDTNRLKNFKESNIKHCRDCQYYTCEPNMLKGYCNRPANQRTGRCWGSHEACKKFVKKVM